MEPELFEDQPRTYESLRSGLNCLGNWLGFRQIKPFCQSRSFSAVAECSTSFEEDRAELIRLSTQVNIPSIHDLEEDYLGSGSKATQKQFIALRIVFPEVIEYRFFESYLTSYGLIHIWGQAPDSLAMDQQLMDSFLFSKYGIYPIGFTLSCNSIRQSRVIRTLDTTQLLLPFSAQGEN